jgi:hypothetical protein
MKTFQRTYYVYILTDFKKRVLYTVLQTTFSNGSLNIISTEARQSRLHQPIMLFIYFITKRSKVFEMPLAVKRK